MIRIFLTTLILFSLSFSSTGEELFWEEVRNSNDIELLELYNARYPNGIFRIFADKKIRSLGGRVIAKRLVPFTYGLYKCKGKNFFIKLNTNKSAYSNTRSSGVWSTNGRDANVLLKRKGLSGMYSIKQKYGEYIIYKDNSVFCTAYKE